MQDDSLSLESMDPVELLKGDHNRMEQLIDEYEEADDTVAKKQIADTFLKEIMMHNTIEEEIFFPYVRDFVQQEDIVDDAISENEAVRTTHQITNNAVEANRNIDVALRENWRSRKL